MTKIALSLALLFATSSAVLAQYDGDGNLVPGAQQSVGNDFHGAYASTVFSGARSAKQALERDGDGNAIPGSQR